MQEENAAWNAAWKYIPHEKHFKSTNKLKPTSSVFHILDLHDLRVDAASEHVLRPVDGFCPFGGFLSRHSEFLKSERMRPILFSFFTWFWFQWSFTRDNSNLLENMFMQIVYLYYRQD